MGDGAPHEGRMQHARKDEIRDILALSRQKPLILAPEDRLTDEASATHARHCA
jgi:hypothetical protein